MHLNNVRNLREFLKAGLDVLMCRSQANNGGKSETKCSRIDPRAVTFDDAGLLQSLHALRDSGLRQPDGAAKLGQRCARVPLQRFEYFQILRIDASRSVQR